MFGIKKTQQYQSVGSNYYWIKIKQLDGKFKWDRKQIHNFNEPAIFQLNSNQVKSLGFPEKQCWLKHQLNKMRIPWQNGSDRLRIQVNNVVNSSLECIHKVNMHKEVKVDFIGDKVLDAGGLLREWLLLLFKELTNQNLGLFTLAETEDLCYRLNTDVQLENDEYMKNCYILCGKAIGKAVFERLPLNVYFDRPFMKYLIGQEVKLEDIQYYDRQLFNSWQYILKLDINPDELLQYFVVQNGNECHELKPNGIETIVNNENKEEFIQLSIRYQTYEFVKQGLNLILQEIYSVIPKQLWEIFDVEEAEMIIYGVPFINLDEWKEYTDYEKPYSVEHKNIKWFWQILSEFDADQLSKFLQFCTGSTRIPINGFSKLESNRGMNAKFKIVSTNYQNEQSFPKAHTCFNRLELPLYPSFDQQKKFLRSIINIDLEGVFGME